MVADEILTVDLLLVLWGHLQLLSLVVAPRDDQVGQGLRLRLAFQVGVSGLALYVDDVDFLLLRSVDDRIGPINYVSSNRRLPVAPLLVKPLAVSVCALKVLFEIGLRQFGHRCLKYVDWGHGASSQVGQNKGSVLN